MRFRVLHFARRRQENEAQMWVRTTYQRATENQTSLEVICNSKPYARSDSQADKELKKSSAYPSRIILNKDPEGGEGYTIRSQQMLHYEPNIFNFY